MTPAERHFNPPPGWPPVPSGWKPPAGWTPPADWAAPPAGWQLWLVDDTSGSSTAATDLEPAAESEGKPGPKSLDSTRRPRPALAAPASTGSRLAELEAENAELRHQLDAGIPSVQGLIQLDDQLVLQEVGIYRYHHPLENAAAYLPKLQGVETRAAALIREGHAIEKSNLFTFDNSLARGRKMSDDLAKLMLRAYNAESENSIRTLKVGNVQTAKRRLEASREAIAHLGAMMQMRISDSYHSLRLEEIELTADWLMMKQEEKEREREERARLREERRVERELTEQRAQLDKERSLLLQTLETLEAAGTTNPDLTQRLADIDQAIAENDYRAANIRAGYVYVISNRGAFGEGVVKIGLTRRLEPTDRVNELGGASVPFRFDIHTIYFSEDAVTLETELHRHFASRALNQANSRKEFFFATPAEVRDVLASKVGNLLEFTEGAEATEYYQSVSRWPSATSDYLT
ncbi:MAG: putative ATPase [Frondihabitans sp.]|nr:putative ATPase [Frondihabitans sp.]